MSRLWYNNGDRARFRGGQALLEYVLVLAALLVVVALVWGLVGVSRRYADRTENLVTSDCP